MSVLKTRHVQIGQDSDPNNNFTIMQPNPADGSLVICRGNADNPGEEVVTIDANGIVKQGNPGPMFKAAGGPSISVPSGVVTGMNFPEIFDYGDFYNPTNGRYQPGVPGLYFFTSSIYFTTTTGETSSSLLKNGDIIYSTTFTINGGKSILCSGIIALNGTTDYVTVVGYQSSGSTQTTITGRGDIYSFQGYLVRAL